MGSVTTMIVHVYFSKLSLQFEHWLHFTCRIYG